MQYFKEVFCPPIPIKNSIHFNPSWTLLGEKCRFKRNFAYFIQKSSLQRIFR